jgi:hypothetical protein
MRRRPILFLCTGLYLLAAGIAGAAAPAPRVSEWKAVLVAGDNAQPVFDNAIAAAAAWLGSTGAAARDIHILSATQRPDGSAEPASAERILARIAALRPGPGEGCLVYITSHGQRGEGIWLAYSGEYLHPAQLGQALSAGCGRAPTVVIASGCYTGAFTALGAPNRVIITAARADRPSFGCAVERTYSVFDECLLAALSQSATWRRVVKTARGCVSQREREQQVLPSQPQAVFGAAVRDLRVR